MKSYVSIIIPFDLGLELDFVGKDANEIAKDLSRRSLPNLTFREHLFQKAKLTAQIYKFGVGLLQLSFPVEGEVGFLTDISCHTERILVGKTAIIPWAKSLVEGIINRSLKFASYQYETRLTEIDMFPVFVLEKGAVTEADPFIQEHRKTLFGIVSGEPNYDFLSDFVLKEERLVNFGYYENELILIKRFGAVVSSSESDTILKMIRLAYALHWSLRAYNFLLDREIDETQNLLNHLPPYYKFWVMPQRYQKFSKEAISFVRDKLAIVDSLYNISIKIPKVDSDWHLRTIFKNVQKEFDINDLSKAVEMKLERIEESYNSVRDFLSTNFFIAVEIVLILSLAWMVLDTSLLFVIANK